LHHLCNATLTHSQELLEKEIAELKENFKKSEKSRLDLEAKVNEAQMQLDNRNDLDKSMQSGGGLATLKKRNEELEEKIKVLNNRLEKYPKVSSTAANGPLQVKSHFRPRLIPTSPPPPPPSSIHSCP